MEIIADPGEDKTVGETIDDLAEEQRRYWNFADTLPECAEKYTVAYKVGRAIDNYVIAAGLLTGAQTDAMASENDRTELMVERAERHIWYAKRLVRKAMPDFLPEFFKP